MSTLKSNIIEPATGTTLSLGASGDNVVVSSDSLQTNLYKDAGGNTLFQSDGAGTLSNVNGGLLGDGPKLITTNSGDSLTDVDFTTGIDSTYDSYMFVMINLNPDTTEMFAVNFSIDGGSNYNVTKTSSAPYSYHYENSTSNHGLEYWAAGDLANSTSNMYLAEHTGADADESLSGTLYLYAPSDTTYYKQYQFRIQNCTDAGVPVSSDYFGGGYLQTTSAVNAVRFLLSGGGAWSGKIKMYGIL
jgi:hypothetical protein